MNKKIERIKFYRSLRKKANAPSQATLFELYRQTKSQDGGFGTTLAPNKITTKDMPPQGQVTDPTSKKPIPEKQNISDLIEIGTRYDLIDENGAPSKYVKEGDFAVMKFTETVALSGNNQLKTVFKHYYNEKNPSSSYFQIVKASEGYSLDLLKKYTYTDQVFKNLMNNSNQWSHLSLLSVYQKENKAIEEKKEEKSKYKVKRGTQADDFKEGYSDELIKELEQFGGEIEAKEEALEQWAFAKSEAEMNALRKQLEEKQGIGYKLTDAEQMIVSNISESKDSGVPGQGTDKFIREENRKHKTQYTNYAEAVEVEKKQEHSDPLPERNKKKYLESKKEYGVAFHSKFDLIPDGLNNYRGGQPSNGTIHKQYRVLYEKYGVRTVIKLNGGGEGKVSLARERDAVDKANGGGDDDKMVLHLVNAHNPRRGPSGKGYYKTIEVTNALLSRGNCYVHCTGGRDRAGYVIASWLKKLRGITNDNIPGLESLWDYTTQYNSWGYDVCHAGERRTNKETGKRYTTNNSGYAVYLDTFYPVRIWCTAKPDRKNCKICLNIDHYFGEGKNFKKKM